MITNRNSTMMAPAYTSTWSTAMNCASSRTNSAASENSVTTSHRALATGLRRVMQDRALTMASPANAQKMIRVPSTAYSPFGSEGSQDRKSTRLNSSHVAISYAVFCLKKKNELDHKNTTTSVNGMIAVS